MENAVIEGKINDLVILFFDYKTTPKQEYEKIKETAKDLGITAMEVKKMLDVKIEEMTS